MKVLIFNDSIPYNNNYNNVPYFTSEEERDIWLNKYQDSGDYLTDLENKTEITSLDFYQKNVNNTIDISGYSRTAGNYCAIKENNGHISYWFINEITQNGNNNKLTLTLEKDMFMNNLNLMNYITQFNLQKGHVNWENLDNLNIDISNGEYYVDNINEVINSNINGVTKLGTGWFYVYEKLDDDEVGYYFVDDNNITYYMPYKIKVAPINLITFETDESTKYQIYYDYDILHSEDNPNVYWKGNGDILEHVYITPVLNITEESYFELHARFYSFLFSNLEHWYQNKTWARNLYYKDMVDTYKWWVMGRQDSYTTAQIKEIEDKMNAGEINEEEFEISNSVNAGRPISSNLLLSFIKVRYNSLSQNLEFLNPTLKEVRDLLPNVYKYFNGDKLYITDDFNQNNAFNEWSTLNMRGLADWNIICQTEIEAYTGFLENWNSEDLVKYISNPDNTPKVLSYKVSNINPIQSELGVSDINKKNDIVNVDFSGENNNIGNLKFNSYAQYLENNKYTIKFETNLNNILKIKGLIPYKLIIENTKIVDIDVKYINNNQIDFYYEGFLTPNETEERIRWLDTKNESYNIILDDNKILNEKEGIFSIDVLAQYKANNPVSAKLDFLRPFSNPLNFIKPRALFEGAIGNTIGTLFTRESKKKEPDLLSGSGNFYNDVIFNRNNIRLSVMQISYIGNSYISAYKKIFKNGIDNNDFYYVDTYNDIKRPYFNYLQFDLNEAIFNNKIYSESEKNALVTAFQRGVRLWNNPNEAYNYYDVDNGD